MFAVGRNFSELVHETERFSAEWPRKGVFVAIETEGQMQILRHDALFAPQFFDVRNHELA